MNNGQGFSVGDRVAIDSIEGFGGYATIVAVRDSPTARYQVLMEDASQPPFWAHDFEVSGPGYDSRPDTYGHIQEVQRRLGRVIRRLLDRSERHDQSKLITPELRAFDANTGHLRGLTYGSDEYRSCLAAMKPALDHHYALNSHHPEHFPDGIRGMTLLDIIEMLCDWKAATLRHADGDIRRSIEVNQQRFGYSDELKAILLNTLNEIEDTP